MIKLSKSIQRKKYKTTLSIWKPIGKKNFRFEEGFQNNFYLKKNQFAVKKNYLHIPYHVKFQTVVVGYFRKIFYNFM